MQNEKGQATQGKHPEQEYFDRCSETASQKAHDEIFLTKVMQSNTSLLETSRKEAIMKSAQIRQKVFTTFVAQLKINKIVMPKEFNNLVLHDAYSKLPAKENPNLINIAKELITNGGLKGASQHKVVLALVNAYSQHHEAIVNFNSSSSRSTSHQTTHTPAQTPDTDHKSPPYAPQSPARRLSGVRALPKKTQSHDFSPARKPVSKAGLTSTSPELASKDEATPSKLPPPKVRVSPEIRFRKASLERTLPSYPPRTGSDSMIPTPNFSNSRRSSLDGPLTPPRTQRTESVSTVPETSADAELNKQLLSLPTRNRIFYLFENKLRRNGFDTSLIKNDDMLLLTVVTSIPKGEPATTANISKILYENITSKIPKLEL
jgi:hypothetical protein